MPVTGWSGTVARNLALKRRRHGIRHVATEVGGFLVGRLPTTRCRTTGQAGPVAVPEVTTACWASANPCLVRLRAASVLIAQDGDRTSERDSAPRD